VLVKLLSDGWPQALSLALSATGVLGLRARQQGEVGGGSTPPLDAPNRLRTKDPGLRGNLGALLVSIRFRDVAVLMGPSLMGLAAGWGTLAPETMWRVPVLLAATWLLLAHIFCLNDWAGIEADRDDVNKAGRTFLTRGISRRSMGWLALGLGVGALPLFALLPVATLLVAMGFTVLSLLYSHPRVAAKGVPIVSSLLHLTAGPLLFLLGYGLSGAVDQRGILISAYFGIVFAAGHLTQEVGDHEADRRSGMRTNAVAFGKRRAFAAAFLLFTASYVLMVGLGLAGVAPLEVIAVAAFYPANALIFWRAFRGGLVFEDVNRCRSWYRVLFLFIGVIMTLAFLLGRSST
jgi:4-hydroxybenzoate polyprenyltransferase